MDNETPWTPGPWHWDSDGWSAADASGSVYHSDGDNDAIKKYMGLGLHAGRVAIIPLRIDHYEVIYDGDPITPANRRLIAAAPEMAEGYREILALAEIDADDGDLALEALSSVRGIARALLAKIKKGA